MKAQVVLLGNSPMLAGLLIRLKHYPEFQVAHLEVGPDPLPALAEIAPDLVIVELGAPQAKLVLDLLRGCPGLTVVGVDLQRKQVTILSSRPGTATTVDELVLLLRAELGTGSPDEGGRSTFEPGKEVM